MADFRKMEKETSQYQAYARTTLKADTTWHTTVIGHIAHFFEQDPDVCAVILTGSLADDGVQADIWSDIDVKVIMADHSVARYFTTTDWLEPFGRIVGIERHTSPFAKTLRACLEGFRRFDLVFIAESALRGEPHLLQQPCVVLWSTLPDIEAQIAPRPPAPEYCDVTSADIERFADPFWFKATVAIAKVARNDLLIGAHLALDLARDCLVLQMMRRDREKGTTIHRTGGWGNEMVEQLALDAQQPSAHKILNLIRWSCESFDSLAAELSPTYKPRYSHVLPILDLARNTI
jgi:hypothetical protein